MRQKIGGGGIDHWPPRHFAPPGNPHPASLHQHVERTLGSLHPADRFDFSAAHRLVIGDNRQHLGRRAAEAANLFALADLAAQYDGRGVQLVERGGRWHFQTAPDLAHLLRREREEVRRLSRAATEVLAIVAYHEPVSRAEIESIRGVQTAKGTLDVLMEAGWVRITGRREVPGRPVIYATTPDFLTHFGLESRRDLPGIDELRAAGLLDPVEDALAAAMDVPGEGDEPENPSGALESDDESA